MNFILHLINKGLQFIGVISSILFIFLSCILLFLIAYFIYDVFIVSFFIWFSKILEKK